MSLYGFIPFAWYKTTRDGVCTLLIFCLLPLLPTAISAHHGTLQYAYADVNSTSAQYQRILNKIRLVEVLLTRSEPIQKLDSSPDSQVITQLHDARQSMLLAKNYVADSKLDNAESEVNYAIKLLSSVSGPAVKKQQDSAKLREEYQSIRDRVESFRKALFMICKEKNIDVDAALPAAQFMLLINDAEQLVEKSRVDRAIIKISKAANIVETSLAKIRNNETIIHSLKFASIEEEFQYELERNKSHLMLIDLMLSQRSLNQSLIDLIHGLVADNAKLADRATRLHANDNTDEAKIVLEQGTDKLVQALRKGGMFIP